VKAYWTSILLACAVGAVATYWWCTRPNSEHAQLIAHSDSLAARLHERDSLVGVLLTSIDTTQARAGRTAAAGAGERAAAEATAARPIVRPRSASDSTRFWSDSAGKAQEAYGHMAKAAANYKQSYDSVDAELTDAKLALVDFRRLADSIMDANRGLSTALERTRSCSAWCPGIVAGVGYSLAGTPSVFVGVGVRVDPINLIRKIL